MFTEENPIDNPSEAPAEVVKPKVRVSTLIWGLMLILCGAIGGFMATGPAVNLTTLLIIGFTVAGLVLLAGGVISGLKKTP